MKYILIFILIFSQVHAQNITLNLGGSSGGGGAETDPIVKAINGIVKSDGITIVAAAQTGSGSVVLASSPLLFTPRLAATSTTSYVWTATDASGNGSFQAQTGGGDVTLNGTQTLTNKRITYRVGTTASSATPTPDGDANDIYTVTALATNATFGAPTGTPTNGQQLLIRITSDATIRTLAWNAIYRASTDFALPTETVASKTIYIQFIYSTAATKWDAVGLTRDF